MSYIFELNQAKTVTFTSLGMIYNTVNKKSCHITPVVVLIREIVNRWNFCNRMSVVCNLRYYITIVINENKNKFWSRNSCCRVF